jgi:prolipoprotein diacylglyceryltransferase/protein-S-isoprenylcysteine O-methyltransferase Ste14
VVTVAHAIKGGLARVAYGALFVLMWPLLLTWVAHDLDTASLPLWPLPLPPGGGLVLTIAGLALMGISMHALWRYGEGLPMNAFPPPRFVERSVYALVAHPIYAGFAVLAAGVALMVRSRAGFWIVTPIATLASVALVLGYERPELCRRFGRPKRAPLFGLPQSGGSRPSPLVRIGAGVTAFGPWLIAFAAASRLPQPPLLVKELRFAWEFALPHAAASLWVYSLAYLLAPLALWAIPSGAALRRFVGAAWLGTAVGFLIFLILPARAAWIVPADTGSSTWLLLLNREFDAEWLACPSFHAFWAALSACALATRSRLLGVLGWAACAAILGACVLSGAHALIDVVAGLALGFAAWHRGAIWQTLLDAGSHLGNSWSAVEIGPVRIISHFVWSCLGAALGSLVAMALGGPAIFGPYLAVVAGGLLSAGVWGYFLEGGGRLSRPFGYYGFLLGALGLLVLMGLAGVKDIEPLEAALAAGAPIAQAIGRFRCIVQGCCHGRPSATGFGLRISHPCSRVTALSTFANIPIHPTPFYSIGVNGVLALVLYRLWVVSAPSTLIGGLYLALSSLGRFVEEAYRGEPQTRRLAGLASYQWLAIALFVAGLLIIALPGEPVGIAGWFSAGVLSASTGAGLVAGLLMSVDFPRSSWRCSRLTVLPEPAGASCAPAAVPCKTVRTECPVTTK